MSMTDAPDPRAPSRPALLALDLVAVLVFVVLGRRSHTEGESLRGIATTAGPFLVGLAVAWLFTQAWRRPADGPTGIGVWLVTVVIGMITRRVVFDRGTALPFVIVATSFLGASMIGWRFVVWVATRRRGSSGSVSVSSNEQNGVRGA